MKFCFFGDISKALNGCTQGGAELQVALLAKALALKGHDVVIVDPYSEKSFITPERIKVLNVPNWNKGIKGLRLFWYRIPELRKLLLAQKADYYYVRMRSYLHLISYQVARKNNSKLIVAIASDIDVLSFKTKFKYSYNRNSTLFQFLSLNIPNDLVFKYLLKKSDFILLQHTGQHFGSSAIQKNQFLFPNIIKTDGISKIENSSRKYFLYVGRLTMLKGVDKLLELINIVDESVQFMIVGSPASIKANEVFQELKKKGNVVLLGGKNHEETLKLISNAKAVINTSYFEGFSNVFLEAWAAGVPVISLNANPGGILEKYDLGVSCNGDLKKMKQIIESDKAANMDRNKMISYTNEFHQFDTAADRLLNILKNHS